MARLHVWVEGRVQGVSFRFATRRVAVSLGLKGWVRNLPDDRVEAVFEGGRDNCEKALQFCRKGPTSAEVTRVIEAWNENEEGFDDFEIRF